MGRHTAPFFMRKFVKNLQDVDRDNINNLHESAMLEPNLVIVENYCRGRFRLGVSSDGGMGDESIYNCSHIGH